MKNELNLDGIECKKQLSFERYLMIASRKELIERIERDKDTIRSLGKLVQETLSDNAKILKKSSNLSEATTDELIEELRNRLILNEITRKPERREHMNFSYD